VIVQAVERFKSSVSDRSFWQIYSFLSKLKTYCRNVMGRDDRDYGPCKVKVSVVERQFLTD